MSHQCIIQYSQSPLKIDWPKIVLNNKYEFKTVRALARFLGVSESQAHRYMDSPTKYKGNGDKTNLEIDDLEIFENVAYVMALHADPTIPDNINDWLEQFEMLSIYEVLPQILELWGSNLFTDVNARKN